MTKDERWVSLLGADPRPWLVAAEEPAARWVALTGLLDRTDDDPAVVEARAGVLADPGMCRLIDGLPDWEVDNHLSGHSSTGFAPNTLNLLADLGVRGGDDDRIELLLDSMLRHQGPEGRFLSFGTSRASPEPVWGALLCDSHAVTEVLIRFGRGDDSRVAGAIHRMRQDLTTTAQGRAWPCIPHTTTGFRGPGRKTDFCPQVTLEALRCLARRPAADRPAELVDAVRVVLRAWRCRGDEKPYLFGHGTRFKTVKWPTFWYDVYAVLDTVGRYREVWQGRNADPADRDAVAELAACLVAYNFRADGTVIPRSCYRGFGDFSFGQKKRPSPFATARLAVVLRRFDPVADAIASVDVTRLGSSRGGTGTPVAPPIQLARDGRP